MTRVIAHMVTKNEEDRHLAACLGSLVNQVDDIFAYDDRSIDGTFNMFVDAGISVSRRKKDAPSFMDHEGLFRQDGWDKMVEVLNPSQGDIILCIDADELLPKGSRAMIEDLNPEWEAFILPIKEVFDVHADGMLMERTDGEWGSIHGCRIVRYKPHGVFANEAMGCGSVPVTYLEKGWVPEPWLIHLGYARLQDRLDKFNRYTARMGAHASHHIQSIITAPRLRPLGKAPWL